MMEPGAGIQEPVFYSEIGEYHLPACHRLWGHFDQNDTDEFDEHRDEWLGRAANPDDGWVRGIVATTGRGHPIALGLLGYYDDDAYIGSDWDVEPADWYGVMHLSCVSSEYRNRGIGKQLMGQRIEWARERGTPELWGVSWNRDGGADSRPLFEHYGFEAVNLIDDYYREGKRVCPDCGPECRCSATIYRLALVADVGGEIDE